MFLATSIQGSSPNSPGVEHQSLPKQVPDCTWSGTVNRLNALKWKVYLGIYLQQEKSHEMKTHLLKDVHHARPVDTDNHAVRLAQHRDILNDIQMALEKHLLLKADHSAARWSWASPFL